MDGFALKENFGVLFSEIIILIFLLNYMVCSFVYVSDGMMCTEYTVLNRSVYDKYLFEAFHFR